AGDPREAGLHPAVVADGDSVDADPGEWREAPLDAEHPDEAVPALVAESRQIGEDPPELALARPEDPREAVPGPQLQEPEAGERPPLGLAAIDDPSDDLREGAVAAPAEHGRVALLDDARGDLLPLLEAAADEEVSRLGDLTEG